MYKIGAIIGIFLASTGVSMACSLAPTADRMKSIEENYANDKYSYVFLGTVAQVESGSGGMEYLIDIDHNYRGDLSDSIELTTPGHSCGSFYSLGDVQVWFLTDASYVDELKPQYRFNTLALARAQMEELTANQVVSGDKQEVEQGIEGNVPYVQGPSSAPEEGFVGPQSPPPAPAFEEAPTTPWYQRITSWIASLFK